MKELRVTQKQLNIMRHTIGLDKREVPYRNYYAADMNHYNWNSLIGLVNMGLMDIDQSLSSTDTIFYLTDQGCKMLGLTRKEAILK